MVMWGGGSIAAAKRAGRYGLGFFAESNKAGMPRRTKRRVASTATSRA